MSETPPTDVAASGLHLFRPDNPALALGEAHDIPVFTVNAVKESAADAAEDAAAEAEAEANKAAAAKPGKPAGDKK